MLQKVKQLWSRPEQVAEEVPFSDLPFESLALGVKLHFASHAPKPLAGQILHIVGLNSYVFEDQVIESFRLKGDGLPIFQLVTARDEQGYYMAISRLINLKELNALLPQQQEAIARQSDLELPEHLSKDSEWFAARYSTSLQDVRGTLYVGRIDAEAPQRLGRAFRYTLYTSESQDAAIEVEEYNDGTFQLACTLFRDASVVEAIEIPAEPLEEEYEEPEAYEPHLHMVPTLAEEAQTLAEWLDEPKSVTVGFPTTVALGVLNDALYSGQRVSDIVREQIGLDVLGREEVGLTLHLSEADYKELAMRYQLKASSKEAIHQRLQKEITSHYLGVKAHG